VPGSAELSRQMHRRLTDSQAGVCVRLTGAPAPRHYRGGREERGVVSFVLS
jgi:hypothetical protein